MSVSKGATKLEAASPFQNGATNSKLTCRLMQRKPEHGLKPRKAQRNRRRCFARAIRILVSGTRSCQHLDLLACFQERLQRRAGHDGSLTAVDEEAPFWEAEGEVLQSLTKQRATAARSAWEKSEASSGSATTSTRQALTFENMKFHFLAQLKAALKNIDSVEEIELSACQVNARRMCFSFAFFCAQSTASAAHKVPFRSTGVSWSSNSAWAYW